MNRANQETTLAGTEAPTREAAKPAKVLVGARLDAEVDLALRIKQARDRRFRKADYINSVLRAALVSEGEIPSHSTQS